MVWVQKQFEALLCCRDRNLGRPRSLGTGLASPVEPARFGDGPQQSPTQ